MMARGDSRDHCASTWHQAWSPHAPRVSHRGRCRHRCVRDTINIDSFCNGAGAGTWDATCRQAYANCVQAITGQACTPTMTISEGIPTRGDGSAELPGCDLNGDGIANESRMFQAKEAL